MNDEENEAKLFNNFFVKWTQYIGNNSWEVDEEHSSIILIKGNTCVQENLKFRGTKTDFVHVQINKINYSKRVFNWTKVIG